MTFKLIRASNNCETEKEIEINHISELKQYTEGFDIIVDFENMTVCIYDDYME